MYAAETAAPRPALPQALPPIFASKAPARKAPVIRGQVTPAQTPNRRTISPELAAKLNAIATSAAPPAAPRRGEGATDSSSDAVQLEPFVVEEEKYNFKEWQLLTLKGKLDLAYKKHPGLRLGPIPLLNGAVALEMAEEDIAQQRRREMAGLSELMSIGKGLPGATQQQIDAGRIRIHDAAHQPPGTPFRERR